MNIIGHEKIIKFLDESTEKNKLSHSYLFVGQKHLGKFSVALNFAKKITNLKDERISSDIIIIKPEDQEKKKGEIKIEQIRDLEHSLSLSPEGKYKIIIIDNADRMTISAQNSLLKTLEEPRKNCILILVAHDEEKILPTIKSRCLIKKFSLLKKEEISSLIIDKKNQERTIFWASGLPGLAIRLQNEGEELKRRENEQNNLKKLLRVNLSEKFEFCEKMSKNPNEALEILGFWLLIFRQELMGKEKFLEISVKKNFEILEGISKAIETIRETNSNLKSVLENLVLKF